MQTPALYIGGNQIPFAAAWVHLKAEPYHSIDYEVRIPRSLASQVFDPAATRPPEVGWPQFIRSEVDDLGTFIVEGYFRSMKALAPASPELGFEWIITTVDAVREDEHWLIIEGVAERFDPNRFA
jgi:hypothetical protein